MISVDKDIFMNCYENTDFSGAFRNCKSLREINEDIFKGCKYSFNYSYCFQNCTSLTSIPESIFNDSPYTKYFIKTFQNVASINEMQLPEGLFENNREILSVWGCFDGCSKLTSSSNNSIETLMQNCKRVYDYCEFLRGCSSLTCSSGKLWYKFPDSSIPPVSFENQTLHPNLSEWESCYEGCESLSDFKYIPYIWKRKEIEHIFCENYVENDI